jgi:hypothetical protein
VAARRRACKTAEKQDAEIGGKGYAALPKAGFLFGA